MRFEATQNPSCFRSKRTASLRGANRAKKPDAASGPVRGEDHGRAVLTEAIVKRIWELRAEKVGSHRRRGAVMIVRMLRDEGFGEVRVNTVESILNGRNWRHLRPRWADG